MISVIRLYAASLSVTLADGFGIATESGSAFDLTSLTNGLTFTDIYGASIMGSSDGVDAQVAEKGALSITTTGEVLGITGVGINAYVAAYASDLTISAAVVRGGITGSYANSESSGNVSVTATGDVSGTLYDGIHARNDGADLSITSAGGNSAPRPVV